MAAAITLSIWKSNNGLNSTNNHLYVIRNKALKKNPICRRHSHIPYTLDVANSVPSSRNCVIFFDSALGTRAAANECFTFTFSICCRPSVCRLSVVGNDRAPYSGGCNFWQYFYGVPLGTLTIR